MLRGLGHRLQLDQDVLAGELAVRIAAGRHVAVRLHAIMEIENLGRRSERGVELFLAPDIERALASSSVAAVYDRRRSGSTLQPDLWRS